MQKRLSIIIPQYSETDEDIYPLLASINNQIGIDFATVEVIIVNDCSDVQLKFPYQKLLKNISPKYIICAKNLGCGAARQKGIDVCLGEYFTCIDADDILYAADTLYQLLHNLEQTDADVVRHPFLEEIKTAEKAVFLMREAGVWVHGVVYKTTYCKDKNIRYLDELRVQEDSYYNNLVYAQTKKIKWVKTPFLIWRNNEKSTTRENGHAYRFASLKDVMRSNSCLVEELVKRGLQVQANELLLECFYYLFFTFNGNDFLANAEKYRNEAFGAFTEYIQKNSAKLQAAPQSLHEQIYRAKKLAAIGRGDYLNDHIGVAQFCNYLQQYCKNIRS